MLLVTADIGARERLTRALRGHGVNVAERRDGSPPAVDVVIVDTRTQARTQKQLDMVQADVRMRWASVVSIDFAKVAPVGGMPADLEALTEVVEPAVGADRALLKEVLREEQLVLRLAPLGPIRILRVVAASGRTMHLTFEAMRVRGEIDVADGLVVCAFSSADGRDLEGGIALAPLLDLDDALIRIQRCEHPTAVNVMEPVDQALELAAVERQSLMQPLPANDTGALLEAAAETDVSVLEDFSILEEIQTSGVRAGRSSERPTIDDAPNGPAPEGQAPSLRPVDEASAKPEEASPPDTHRVAVGSTDKKFVKTMMGAAAPRPPSPGPPARPAAPPPAPEPAAEQASREAPAQVQSASTGDGLSSNPEGKTLWGVAPPPKPSSGLGGLPSPDPRLSMPARENDAAGADAFAQTQLGMTSPLAEAPDRPEEGQEADLPGDDDVTQRPPPPDDAGVIHAESEGLGIGRDHEDAPVEPEGPSEELSIASALSMAIEEASEERSAARAREGAEMDGAVVEPGEGGVGRKEEAPRQVRGAGLRVALAVGALGLGLAGGVLWWHGKQAHEVASAVAQPTQPTRARPSLSAAARASGSAAGPEAPGDVAQPVAPKVTGDSRQGPARADDPKAVADPSVEAEVEPSAQETEPEAREVAEARPNAEGDAERADAPPVETKETPATKARRDDERDQAGSDKMCATARRLERDGAFDEAMQLYEEGRELDPRNPRAYEGITRIQLHRGNYEAAIVAAERAVDLRSRRVRYRVMLGDAYVAAGRADDARHAWREALDLEPDNEAAKQRLGIGPGDVR